jgi:hypothetical protein
MCKDREEGGECHVGPPATGLEMYRIQTLNIGFHCVQPCSRST